MLRRKHFLSRFKALPIEKKFILASSLATLIACFLPWYGPASRIFENESFNAFSGIGFAAGYLIATFSLVMLLIISIEILKPEWNLRTKFPLKESSLFIFLSGQSAFLALLFIPVYSQYALLVQSTGSPRFGIYVVFLSSLIAALASINYRRKKEEFAEIGEDFVHVPRTHRPLEEWHEEAAEEEVIVQEEEPTEQKTMFDQGELQQHQQSSEQSQKY